MLTADHEAIQLKPQDLICRFAPSVILPVVVVVSSTSGHDDRCILAIVSILQWETG
ncbi:MAG: hypothetical protein ACAF41_21495 [Leptolyngbya sp. BL-A-14]